MDSSLLIPEKNINPAPSRCGINSGSFNTPRPENRTLQGADELWPLGYSAQSLPCRLASRRSPRGEAEGSRGQVGRGTPGFSPGGLHFEVLDLGLVDYEKCLSFQRGLSEDVFCGRKPSTLIFCEHKPVITLGRLAGKKNILRPLDEIESRGIGIASVNRGGDVSLHLPGQLMAYPVFDLRLLGRDINRFLRNLEKTIILLLNDYGIEARSREGQSGAWVDSKKIASMGIAISHWVSTHGLALNVSCDLDLFSLIKPCGQDIIMTSMAELIPSRAFKMDVIKEGLAEEFNKVFSPGG